MEQKNQGRKIRSVDWIFLLFCFCSLLLLGRYSSPHFSAPLFFCPLSGGSQFSHSLVVCILVTETIWALFQSFSEKTRLVPPSLAPNLITAWCHKHDRDPNRHLFTNSASALGRSQRLRGIIGAASSLFEGDNAAHGGRSFGGARRCIGYCSADAIRCC